MTNRQDMYPEPNRKEALGVNGVVATAHPLATEAALHVLKDGGNAFDAAICALATLNVVEPYMSGVGGIGSALVYSASEKRVRALNFSGKAPNKAEPAHFDPEIQNTGVKSALVPGNVAGWFTLLETYGSMEAERLFEPAINYAETGFPVTSFNHRHFEGHSKRVLRFPEGKSMIYPKGVPPKPGSRLTMPTLAASLKRIAKYGRDEFYSGEIADMIIDSIKDLGGLLTADDLASYEAKWEVPISIEYLDHRIVTLPPNSSAFQVLQTLKVLEGYELEEISYQNPATLHKMIEAIKLCIADRVEWGGDPEHVDAPLERLLSNQYTSERRKSINPIQAGVNAGDAYVSMRPEGAVEPGHSNPLSGLTTHLSILDRDGNVVSLTQTLGGGFGSAFAVPKTGIFLNNMMSNFHLDDRSPNVMGPGKRVEFCIAPTQVFRNQNFMFSIGTPGAHTILQSTPQMIMGILNHGMNIQQAIEAPRFSCTTGLGVGMEERFPPHIRRALQMLGHEVLLYDAWTIGGAQGILIDTEEGILHGGADPRRDGLALAY